MRTTLVKFSSAANDQSRFSHKYNDSDEEEWRTFRYFGLFASFCALGFSAVAVFSRSWVIGKGYSAGLWDNCQYNVSENFTMETCTDRRTQWQSSVIGLMLFAFASGLLGTVLCTAGVCVESLYMKMYYFHSAGEIYMLCTLSITAALVMYLTVVEFDPGHRHRRGYGAGYALAWISDCLFAAASVCMCLDDITNSLCAGRRRHGNANRNQGAPSGRHTSVPNSGHPL